MSNEDAIRYLKLYDGPLDLVIDIGAHVGEFSLYAAERGAGRVIAYEPNPDANITLMQEAHKRNLNGKLTIEPVAVAGAPGKRDMIAIEGGMSSFAGLIHNTEANLTVDCVAFADVLAGKTIDYLKIDVEGAEYELFQSVNPVALRRVRFLDLEIHHTRTHYKPEADMLKLWLEKLCGFTKDAFPVVHEKHGLLAFGRFNEKFSNA